MEGKYHLFGMVLNENEMSTDPLQDLEKGQARHLYMHTDFAREFDLLFQEGYRVHSWNIVDQGSEKYMLFLMERI